MRKYFILGLLLSFAIAPCAQGQSTDPDSVEVEPSTPAADVDSVAQAPAPTPTPKKSRPIYFGATIGLSLGDYFRISIAPMIGYSVSPKISVGGRVIYEYIEDKRYTPTLTASNYGASAFARYRIVPPLYVHGELAALNYETRTSGSSSDREWVPFLLLGGGYVKPVGRKTSVFVEVLFDVLQDSNSPYEKWNPWISVGVASGF